MEYLVFSLNKAFVTKYLIIIFASPYSHSFRSARGILLNLKCANRFCNLITMYYNIASKFV